MSHKHQEYKFVEWSKSVTEENYDVNRILEEIESNNLTSINVLDVGGGVGSVAGVIARADPRCVVDVIESSTLACNSFLLHERVNLLRGDYLATIFSKKYDYIIFRTVLHHLIDQSEFETREIQVEALIKARKNLAIKGTIFVLENIYKPLFGNDLTGRIIFLLTSSKKFAWLFRIMGANTAGTGVRFRSLAAWEKLIIESGLRIEPQFKKQQWGMPLWQRVPLLCIDRYQILIELKTNHSS